MKTSLAAAIERGVEHRYDSTVANEWQNKILRRSFVNVKARTKPLILLEFRDGVADGT